MRAQHIQITNGEDHTPNNKTSWVIPDLGRLLMTFTAALNFSSVDIVQENRKIDTNKDSDNQTQNHTVRCPLTTGPLTAVTRAATSMTTILLSYRRKLLNVLLFKSHFSIKYINIILFSVFINQSSKYWYHKSVNAQYIIFCVAPERQLFVVTPLGIAAIQMEIVFWNRWMMKICLWY